MATEQELKARWRHPKGKKIRQKIIEHVRDMNWERFIKDFPFLDEVPTKRDLRGIDLKKENLDNADLCKAYLGGAILLETKLWNANLQGADLRGANLQGAFLRGTNFVKANLQEALLDGTHLLETNFRGADLTGASVYGIAAWGIKTNNSTITKDLIVSKNPLIKVDDLEVAQFIYLINNNEKISNIIKAMKNRSVLILGSFGEGKKTLDFIKKSISENKKNYIPIVFDFDPVKSQTLIDTINFLSLVSSFIIIDLTIPAGQLLELAQFDKLHVPYAMICNEKVEHVSKTIEKYTLSEWCYEKDLVYYSDDDGLKDLVNNLIPEWAETKVDKYYKDIDKIRKKIEDVDKNFHKRNKGKK